MAFFKLAKPSLFICLFSLFSHDKYSTNLTTKVYLDGLLGTRTRGSRMVSRDESTELGSILGYFILLGFSCRWFLSMVPDNYVLITLPLFYSFFQLITRWTEFKLRHVGLNQRQPFCSKQWLKHIKSEQEPWYSSQGRRLVSSNLCNRHCMDICHIHLL